MTQLVPFEPEHLLEFENYGGQERIVASVSLEEAACLKEAGPAYTAICDGKPVGSAGLIRVTPYRAVGWGLFVRTGGPAFLGITRATKWALTSHGFKRIEAYVDPLRPEAIRWVKLLGFQLERAYMPFYFPNGAGASAWVLYP